MGDPDFGHFPLLRKGHAFEDFHAGQVFEHHWGRTLGIADNVLFTTATLAFTDRPRTTEETSIDAPAAEYSLALQIKLTRTWPSRRGSAGSALRRCRGGRFRSCGARAEPSRRRDHGGRGSGQERSAVHG